MGVDVTRRTDRIKDLAEDTCRVGMTVALEMNKLSAIENCPAFTPVPQIQYKQPIEIHVEYESIPAIGIADNSRITVEITNHSNEKTNGILEIRLPEGWEANIQSMNLTLLPGKKEQIPLLVEVPESIQILNETNMLRVAFHQQNGIETNYDFGLVGAAVWKLYGPFWGNNIAIPRINYWDSYYPYIKGATDDETADLTRTYHLNSVVDPDKEYMPEPGLSVHGESNLSPAHEGKLINIYTDKFSVNDFIGLEGPCVLYLVRYLDSPDDRTVGIHIGNTDAYKLWINDLLISESRNTDWCTNENNHILKLKLNKGINRMVFKLARRSFKADYSLIFCEGAPCTNHITDFSSKNPLLLL